MQPTSSKILGTDINTAEVRPQCAKCDKPVDMILRDPDQNTGEITYTVRCHGETQSVTLRQSDIMAAFNIEFEKAFAPMVAAS